MGATFRYAWCGTRRRAYRVVRASRALISSVIVSLTLSTGPTWGGDMLNDVNLTCVVATPVTVRRPSVAVTVQVVDRVTPWSVRFPTREQP